MCLAHSDMCSKYKIHNDTVFLQKDKIMFLGQTYINNSIK